MSKELEALEDIILYLNASEPKGLYCENIEIIKNALKNYEELTNKQVILCGRKSRKTQAIIDMICKNYKEVAITNLEDDKRLKAFGIIKEKRVDVHMLFWCFEKGGLERYNRFLDAFFESSKHRLTKEQFDLLKEVLKDE